MLVIIGTKERDLFLNRLFSERSLLTVNYHVRREAYLTSFYGLSPYFLYKILAFNKNDLYKKLLYPDPSLQREGLAELYRLLELCKLGQ